MSQVYFNYSINADDEISGIIQRHGDIGKNAILQAAKQIICERYERQTFNPVSSPDEARKYLRALVEGFDRERFVGIFLDTQNYVIRHDVIFEGTLDSCSVYPREVVKKALQYNANSVMVVHQHPSGCSSPSIADIRICKRLKDALAVVDITLLDGFVVGQTAVISLAERGEI